MSLIKGIDVSHFNNVATITKYLSKADTKFCICKCTEGATYRDAKYNSYKALVKQYGKVVGAYHYARPENNTPQKEVDNFLANIGDIGDCMLLALDWEGNALKYSYEWALEWLQKVYEKTGIHPLFYCQQSALKNKGYEKIEEAGFGLWVARYAANFGDLGKFKNAAMWQFTSDTIDQNIFYGDIHQLKKYGTTIVGTDPSPDNVAAEYVKDFEKAFRTWFAKWEKING